MRPESDRARFIEVECAHVRHGFTLVELLIAGVVTAFVLGSVSMSLGQLGRAKSTSKLRFDAHIRSDSALNALRQDIVSILRSDDLFYTRFLLTDDTAKGRDGEVFNRDEVLIFNTRLRPLRDIDFVGEGFEYETQYRVADDDLGPVLWVRHDAMPDEYPAGGGMATPKVEGILGLNIEAYDGSTWYDQWDSDAEGLPVAVRITVVSSGHRGPDDIFDAPCAVLRTVVSIDRVLSPKDLFQDEEEEEDGEATDEQTDEGADDGTGEVVSPTGGGGGGPGEGPRPSRPGQEGGDRPRGGGNNGPRPPQGGPGTGSTPGGPNQGGPN